MAGSPTLPPAAKGGALAAGGGVLGATAMVLRDGTLPWYFVLLFAVLTVVLVVGLMWLVVDRLERRRARRLDRDLADSTKGGEGSKAQLEELRRRFQDGIAQYRKAGKGLYEKPWFLVMGHPGSGKTFAVQNSGIFGDVRTEPTQGAGGTATMDWWFARDAILLDTAGRYVEGARNAGHDEQRKRRQAARQQLESLLALLRRHRTECPINGLILVIAASDLLTEDNDERVGRAQELHATLMKVQQDLDVRFPVTVWVTKCDKIAGFRQFFRAWKNDPGQRHQMFGWSNPSTDFDRNEFDVEDLKHALNSLGEKLRERRWALLRDLRPGDGETRVSAASGLFAFPEAWKQIVPPLAKYLTSVFVTNDAEDNHDAGGKRPYFRGVYFTSAITEGAELDRELAELTGRSLRSVRDDEEERKRAGESLDHEQVAYFLRDTLVEKLFKERYLVSRYSNAVTALRRKQWLLIGCSAVVLVLMLGWAWFAQDRLKQEIGRQASRWENLMVRVRLGRAGDAPSEQALRLLFRSDDGTLNYRGQKPIRLLQPTSEDRKEGAGGPSETLLEFYSGLYQQARVEFRPSLLFRLFPEPRVGRDVRETLWRRAFTTYALGPVFDEAGEVLRKAWRTNTSPGALEAFVRWEHALHGTSSEPALLGDATTSRLGEPLLRLLTDGVPDGPDFRTEELARDARKFDELASAALTVALSRGSNLASNVTVSNALTSLHRHLDESVRLASSDLSLVENFLQALDQLDRTYNAWGNAAYQLRPSISFDRDTDETAFRRLAERFQDYAVGYDSCTSAWISLQKANPGAVSAAHALDLVRGRVAARGLEDILILSNRLAAIPSRGVPLAREVMDASLLAAQAALRPVDERASGIQGRLAAADRTHLAALDGGASKMAFRHDAYVQALRLWDRALYRTDGDLVAWRLAATNLVRRLDPVVQGDPPLVGTVNRLLQHAWNYHTNRLGQQVAEEVHQFTSTLHFPFVRDRMPPWTLQEVLRARDRFAALRDRLAALGRTSPELDRHLATAALFLDDQGSARSLLIQPMTQAMLRDAGAPREARELLDAEALRGYGAGYRLLRLNDSESVDLASDLNAFAWKTDLERPGLRVEVAKKTSDAPRYESAREGPGSGPWGVLAWLDDAGRVGAARWSDSQTNSVAYVRVRDPEGKPLLLRVTLEFDNGRLARWFGQRAP